MSQKTPREIVELILKQYQAELVQEIEKSTTLLALKRIYDGGKVLELALRRFLEKILPNYVGITRGIIFSSDLKAHSDEIDLILYDNRYFPGFVIEDNTVETISYVSIDTVLGIISVKKTLNLDTWRNSIENINSVYKLYRKPIKNQLHYDLKLTEGYLEYRGGQELNPIFSCIFAYKNEFLYCIKDKKEILRNKAEMEKYFDSFHEKKLLDGFRIDLIATLDGTMFFPVSYSEQAKAFVRTAELSVIGSLKKALILSLASEFPKNNQQAFVVTAANSHDVLLSYTIDLANPEKSLGQFITYIQMFVSSLIKSMPDIHLILNNCFDSPIETIMSARTPLDIIKDLFQDK